MSTSSSSRCAPRTQNLELKDDFGNFSQCRERSVHAHNFSPCCVRSVHADFQRCCVRSVHADHFSPCCGRSVYADHFSPCCGRSVYADFQRCCVRLDHTFISCQCLFLKPGMLSPVIGNGAEYKLWSLMSTQQDQYVKKTGQAGKTESSFTVNANGSATDSATLVMHRIKPVSELKLHISFGNSDYYLGADMETLQVEAVEINNRNNNVKQTWKIYQPNQQYYVIGLIQENKTKYFISSDGEGNMKLKQLQDTADPHFLHPHIDPALLFRLVDP